MTTFAKEFCENRLHLSKKQAFCIRFALFLSDDLIRFSMIDQIIAYNKTFVEQKGYEKYLTELLPAALGLKNGDAKTIKTHPLVPKDIVVRGFIIDSETGALEEIN